MLDNPSFETILARMQQSFQAQAGFHPDDASDIGIRMKVLAGEVFSLYHAFHWLKKQAFPQTAQDDFLALHAQQRGLSRKPALAASGSLTFSRQTALAYDLTIPAGTVASTQGDAPLRFATTQASVLKAGYTSVSVPAAALAPGAGSNAAAGTVCVLVTPPPGIESVSNTAPFSGGVDAESDDLLRTRLLQSYAQVSNGTNPEFYRAFALQFDGVQSVGVVPQEDGPGTLSLYLAARGGAPDEALLTEIQNEINKIREITVTVTVKAAAQKTVRLACYLQPLDPYSFDEVKPICDQAMRDYFASLSVGQPFIMTHLGKALLATGAVKNYRFYSVSADTAVANTEIAVPGTVSWTKMTSTV